MTPMATRSRRNNSGWPGPLCACPAGSMIVDAPCGTGKYFTMVAAAGHRVACADQSAGMLTQAGHAALPSRYTRSGSRNWTISASSTPS